jgi:hypothetical protein
MMGQIVGLPNMQWRRRRLLRNATAKFLCSEEYTAMQERNKAEREKQIGALFDRDIQDIIEDLHE